VAINVSKFREGIRGEGLGMGLPMLFVELGEGNSYPRVEDLVGDIISICKCKWVCVIGEDATQASMGSVAKALNQFGYSQEYELSGLRKDPSWMHSVSRWIVDYEAESNFNYGSLRSSDCLRFNIAKPDDLIFVREGFNEVSKITCVRYIKLVLSGIAKADRSKLVKDCIDLAKANDRSRIYLC